MKFNLLAQRLLLASFILFIVGNLITSLFSEDNKLDWTVLVIAAGNIIIPILLLSSLAIILTYKRRNKYYYLAWSALLLLAIYLGLALLW